jgi:hypothetical protein
VSIRLPLVLLAALAGAALVTAAPASTPDAQTDLDAFMGQVLAARDGNWKKLQQYILDERSEITARGPAGIPVWGERREYTWFIREGYFIRSPVSANGVAISEADRRKAEDAYLRRTKEREKRDAARGRGAGEAPAGPERIPEDAPSLDAFLTQTRQPGFIDTAYFMKFKFEEGRYALVGRETFDGRAVLRIEYYPAQLFRDEPNPERDARRAAEREKNPRRGQDVGDTMQRMLNKVSLVTLWVEPQSHQIVKYIFDNVNLDFMPGAWLFRLDDLKASMTMGQPFKDVWLPSDIEMRFGATIAVGSFDVRYRVDYHDYREATTSARIKRADAGR